MNGKQVTRLRKMAKAQATSYNETTFNNTFKRQLGAGDMGWRASPINIFSGKDGQPVFVQRRLGVLSEKALLKSLKQNFKNLNHLEKQNLR
jgi:hypothetical protein